MSLLGAPDVFRFVLESLQAGVYLVDLSRRIVCWNDGAERISGYLRQDVVGRICGDKMFLHSDEQGSELCGNCPLAQTMLDGKKREISVYLRHKAGHLVPVHVWCVPIRDAHGNVIGASETFEESKPSAGFEVRFQELAAHGCLDLVTGLPNQAFTTTRGREQIGRFAEHHLPFSILIISLAEDKVFTTARGNPAADRMLQSAAQTLSNVLRPADFLGRWQGDQLLAILVGDLSPGKHVQPIGKLLGLSRIHWWGDSVPVSVVIAGAEPETGDTVETLVERAQAKLMTGEPGKQLVIQPASPRQSGD
jgi:diguanylate cyclase (GGDEF)-like protein/PAS domain S-box-containing protein